MPDISMCQNKSCSKRKKCYRFTAEPSNHQSYMAFKLDKNGNCNFYINRKNPWDRSAL